MPAAKVRSSSNQAWDPPPPPPPPPRPIKPGIHNPPSSNCAPTSHLRSQLKQISKMPISYAFSIMQEVFIFIDKDND